MPRPVPVRRALGAVLTAAAVLAGGAVVATSGTPAGAQVPTPGFPGASPSATPTTSGTPTPSVSPSATVSPSASASPTATTCPGVQLPVGPCLAPPGGSSPSATPTASTSPSSSPSTEPTGPAKPVVTVSPSVITAGGRASVAGTAAPGTEVELQAYSRPSTRYVVVRSTTVGDDGRFAFSVAPQGNTRLFVTSSDETGSTDSDSAVLNVRSALSLKVDRVGTRTYRFSGNVLPKRAGQQVRITYRKGSGQVEVVRTKVASNGSYSVRRTFSGTGTFEFTARTSTDVSNAAGTSVVRKTTVR